MFPDHYKEMPNGLGRYEPIEYWIKLVGILANTTALLQKLTIVGTPLCVRVVQHATILDLITSSYPGAHRHSQGCR